MAFEDLTGKTFNRLTVLQQNGRNKSRSILWLCRCECGNVVSTTSNNLRTGHTKSCGCLQKEVARKRNIDSTKDLTGERFGRLVVINQVPNHKNRVAWRCICDCGKEAIVTGHELKCGDTKSCGCYCKEKQVENGKNNVLDLIGLKFGRLTVVQRVDNKKGNAAWRCICDCGNETVVTSHKLTQGTQSCGCYIALRSSETKLIDLTGKQFGNLTVLRKIGRVSHDMLWECRCKCGNICNIKSSLLRYGSTNGCPECDDKRSKGEKAISTFLQKNNIFFETQKRFSDCCYKRQLPFDFYLPEQRLAIEYDGEQHFRPVNLGGMSDESAIKEFELTQKRDKIKDRYCQTNGIQLIRIPYTQFDSIEAILNQQLA